MVLLWALQRAAQIVNVQFLPAVVHGFLAYNLDILGRFGPTLEIGHRSAIRGYYLEHLANV
jgi:hypothetical protein